MQPNGKIEGHAPSKLIQLIKKHGYNEGLTFAFGTVLSSSPLTFKIDGVSITFDESDIVSTETFRKLSLNQNDRIVLLVDSEKQLYVILDKVV